MRVTVTRTGVLVLVFVLAHGAAVQVRSQGTSESVPLYLPLALAGSVGSAPEPAATSTLWPEPSSTVTAPPSPVPTRSGTVTPFPTPAGGRVVFQSANFGGLPWPPYFQGDIQRAPWLTLYEDGSYVRAVDLSHHALVTGRMSEGELKEALDRLEINGKHFEYPSEDRFARCVTDGSNTYSTLYRSGRVQRVASYLMLWLGMHPDRCPPGSPGMPISPETERFYALAREMAALNAPLSDTEVPYRVEHATVYAELPPTESEVVDWPFAVPISQSLGADALSPDDYATLLDAIQLHRPSEWSEYAVFRDPEQTVAVGVRVEVPDWLEYCAGEPWCHP